MEPFEIAEHPVGLDQAAEDFQNEILKRGNPDTIMILGIAGMSGIGKSSLATHLYKLRRSDFMRSSFLSDVSKTDLISLQGKLFRDLLGHGFQIYYPREWRCILRDRLLGLRVLIVLDDVDHIDQINSLLVPGSVGSGSLILITSRDKDLLRRSSVKALVYDVKPLQAKYSRELFCWHAFGQSEPSEGFEDLVEGFLKICGGLPLSLKVMGEQFVGRCDKEYWKKQLEKISTTLRPDNIIDSLKVSYETLNTEEKQIFLDIGCFFVGEDKVLVVRVFEGLGCSNVRDCLQSLHQKCLVDFQELSVNESEEIKFAINLRRQVLENRFSDRFCTGYTYCLPNLLQKSGYKVKMHDQIRELARHIAQEEFRAFPMFKPLRLCSSDDIQQILLLQYRSDSFEIRGIRSLQSENEARDITNYSSDVTVRGLKLLAMESSSSLRLSGFSGDLVWLRLHNFDLISFPSTISLRSLRVLELRGSGESLHQLFSKVNDQPPEQLSELNIDQIMGSPIGSSSSRQLLDLQEHSMKFYDTNASASLSDRNVSSAQKEDPVLAYLFRFIEWIGRSIRNLDKLVLHNINISSSLPINFAELKKLRYLDLSGCNRLTKLPRSFAQLLQLQYLLA